MTLWSLLLAVPLWAADPAVGVHRLPGGAWEFKQDSKTVVKTTTLSGLQRVVVLPAKGPAGWVSAATWRDGAVVTGLLTAKAFQGGTTASPNEERLAFAADAAMTVHLAGGLDRGDAPAFTDFRSALAKKLACVGPALASGRGWERFKKLDQAGLAVNLADKPETLRRLKAFAFSGLNPKTPGGSTLSEETLVIPLSAQWFKTSAVLEKRYKEQFANGKWDARFVGGASGEGISGATMLDYQSQLLSLRDFVKGLDDKALAATPEYAWLTGLSEDSFKGLARMIFISEHTWDYSIDTTWAEYIAIDQAFGPVKGQPLFSILVHEINVNSLAPPYLATDTHLDKESVAATWDRFTKEGPAFLKDPREASMFLALNPLLGAVALGYHLDALARASGVSCP